MRPKKIKELLSKALDNPEEAPPIFIWGPPGVGKSAICAEVAEEKKVGFIDMRLVQKDPTDLRGIPIPQMPVYKDGKMVEPGKAIWLSPSDLPPKGWVGILFLDELTSAVPLTQASAYQLTFDRKLGEYELPEGCYIVAAGNRIQDRAVVHRMSSALMNRFVHINFGDEIDGQLFPNLDDWIDWALGVQISPAIIGFLKWKPDMLFKFRPDAEENAFPTPRSWDFADRMMKFTPKGLLNEVLEGTIGKGAAAEFAAFLKVQNELPNLEEIFQGSNFVPTKIDLKYALVSALAMRAKTGAEYGRLLDYSFNLPAEFSVLLVTMLVSQNEEQVVRSKSWGKWAKEHSEIVVRRKMI